MYSLVGLYSVHKVDAPEGAPLPIGPVICAIHSSAWNGHSPKFGCSSVHKSPSEAREDGLRAHPLRRAGVYILW
jgi:hypothetical protein